METATPEDCNGVNMRREEYKGPQRRLEPPPTETAGAASWRPRAIFEEARPRKAGWMYTPALGWHDDVDVEGGG